MVWIFDSNSYFVDPGMADDTGDGLTELTAKKTIAAAIGLTPPAGSTIFLAGGSHTVAAGTQVVIPIGVDLVGAGHIATIVTGDSEDSIGNLTMLSSHAEGIGFSSTGGDGAEPVQIRSSGPARLHFKGCSFTGVGIGLEGTSPASGRSSVIVEDCFFDNDDLEGIAVVGNYDLVVKGCVFQGDNVAIRGTVSTQEMSVAIDDTTFGGVDITTAVGQLTVSSSGTGYVEATVKDSSFFPGDTNGVAIAASLTSSGPVSVVDAGGNNLTTANVTLTGGAVLLSNLDAIEAVLPSASAKMAGEGTTAKNLDQVSGGVVGGGGAPIHGRMDYVGFLDNRVLDVIVGEEQRLTVVLETDGTFPLPVTLVSIKAVDIDGTSVTVDNVDVARVVEDSQVYAFRFTLTTTHTAQFVAGLLDLEVSLDNEKAQILGAVDMIASLS